MDPDRQGTFLALYEECADAVFRHCFYRLHDRELAEDMTQEAFTRTWEYVAGGKEIENLKAFTFRVANNLIIDHWRKRKTFSLDVLAESGFDPSGDDHEHIVTTAESKEALRAIDTLDPMYRQILTLRYVNDFSIEEIAEVIGESENAVSVRIHRALKKIKEHLEHGRA